ncbi:hypothetical protein NN561_007353 [Cricetulus griseus]
MARPWQPGAARKPLGFQIQTMAAGTAMDPGSGRGFPLLPPPPEPGSRAADFCPRLRKSLSNLGAGLGAVGDQWAVAGSWVAWLGVLRVSPGRGRCERAFWLRVAVPKTSHLRVLPFRGQKGLVTWGHGQFPR